MIYKFFNKWPERGISSYSLPIVGGVPAKVLKMRFTDDEIQHIYSYYQHIMFNKIYKT